SFERRKQSSVASCCFNARHHRNGIVRALSSAVEATYAAGGIDIDLADGITKDRTGGPTCDPLALFPLHPHLPHKDTLKLRRANSSWPRNTYATAQQTRLPMNFMTSERTIAAADAKIHIHDKDIRTVHNAGNDLFFSSGHRP